MDPETGGELGHRLFTLQSLQRHLRLERRFVLLACRHSLISSSEDQQAPLVAYAAVRFSGSTSNVYSLTVSVGDGFAAPVTQALTITVLDGPEPSGTSIFSAADLPDQTVTNDPSAYELGTRFTPETDGTVTELRYFRGLADAADTDTRALTLWSADGTVLATVTSIALPQEAGWQGVALPVPVALQAGETYIVSYGTNRNYAVTSGGFAAPFENADGTLTVGIDGGVFATSPGQLPTASYGASNYFVDVLFEPELTVGRGETSGASGRSFPKRSSSEGESSLFAKIARKEA